MKPERLQEIERLYHAALEREESQRAMFLREACGADESLRREVESLLAYGRKAEGIMELPAIELAARALGESTSDQHTFRVTGTFVPLELPRMEERRLGGYTLVREIGRGGMGVVYLAERSDGVFRKQSAVKLVLPSVNSAGVIARFQQEREILASLDHPNIAKLLDGGVTEEGWPYFVMEFVDGQPIDRWCDERKLNISRRIELFRGVISAVQYAHRRLVVHRDLKPSNIFVTNDGTVKLLDFGIAKVLSAPDTGKTAETQTLARMMTPEYASPEQVNGHAITTLSDVYSLGVTLYELLTGHQPYCLLSAAAHEIARVIAEVEPTRPSDVVATECGTRRDRTQITPDTVSIVREGDPVRLRKRLVGDLDCILLMALQKEPDRRYGSAESLAEDLQRHLEYQPVTAREATLWYRVRRFCGRNPGGVAAGVLVVLSLLAGAATLIWQAGHSLHSAPLDSVSVFLIPVWTYLSTFAALAVGAAVYLLRLDRKELPGAAVGGVGWGIVGGSKWWLGYNLGWWRSRFRDTPDPLMVLSPPTWLLTFPLFGMLFLLLLLLVGRRFGWKGQAISLVVFGLYQETFERVFFSTFLPALTYQWGLTPILGCAAILIAGGVIGLLVMRLITGFGAQSRNATARIRRSSL
jgi:serine/threonine protein kinase